MPEVSTSLAQAGVVTKAARAQGKRIGFVPTMGALHAGHAALIEAARERCDLVVTSIFVNPLQFGDQSDLERYPRTLDQDLEVAGAAGCDLVVTPEVAELYPTWPEPPSITVTAGPLARRWEGASRPGHFDGVTTVVAKLFGAIGPCLAVFGQKDFQQLAIVTEMVEQLFYDVELLGIPTVREPDGLARSSRNVRLSPQARAAAAAIPQALLAAQASAAQGGGPAALTEAMAEVLAGAGSLLVPDYTVVVDRRTLEPLVALGEPNSARLLIAAVVDGVRLIDNAGLAEPLEVPTVPHDRPERMEP